MTYARFRKFFTSSTAEKKASASSKEIEFVDFNQHRALAKDLRKTVRELIANLPTGTLKVAVIHKNKRYDSKVVCEHLAGQLRKETRLSASAENIKNLSDFIQTLKEYTKNNVRNTQPKKPTIKEPLSPRSETRTEQSVSSYYSESSSQHKRFGRR